MNHEAIYAIHPNVVSINDELGAFDANGDKVEIDLDAVNAWVNPNQYKMDRANAYPSIAEQLDQIYHEGIDAWKETIAAVKTQHPKPESN